MSLSALSEAIRRADAQGRIALDADRYGVRAELRREAGRLFPLRRSYAEGRAAFRERLRQTYAASVETAATGHLAATDPVNSAHRLLTPFQSAAFAAIALAAAIGIVTAPIATVIALNAFATIYFVAAIAFRTFLAGLSIEEPLADVRNDVGGDPDPPTVSILLPLFREAESLPSLAAAIGALDYPASKLDVKLILEEGDEATRNEALSLGLDRNWDMIVVPPSHPQTKPKACNFALAFARGKLTVIYDAEDAPEPDQLQKAAAAFAAAEAAGDDKLVCVQARLNYYNAEENWITRLFALEYALWFDSLLPALRRLGAPIPLGGTSNVFRTDKLREIGAWDPHNVTEDADLGLRIARKGYRTELIASTTFEEANYRLGNWLRQRSRWMKGYIQTWLVDLRNPAPGVDGSRWRGLASTQMFIAGTAFSALINPILWGVFLYWLATRSSAVGAIFPEPLLSLNLFALLVGNALFIYLAMIAPLKRGWSHLSPWALLMPVYWWMTSLAAYMALWQLFTKPSYWEKTDHAVSALARERGEAARSALEAARRTVC